MYVQTVSPIRGKNAEINAGVLLGESTAFQAVGEGSNPFTCSIITTYKTMSITLKNLESALAGESMAYIKYRYFAKLARAEGYEAVAKHFEHTAEQEIKHAWGHLELLIGQPSTLECLNMAIAGETYEYTEMYPSMEEAAEQEHNEEALLEARLQAQESKQHAQEFQEILAKAQKRFAALKRVEQRHADAYQHVKDSL